MTITPDPSLSTKPSRFLSKGLVAFSGASLKLVAIARMAAKPGHGRFVNQPFYATGNHHVG
jgi:hypothetical protein